MATNLLDAIRGVRPGVTDETQKLGALLRARSGREVSAPEIAPSNLAELSEASATQQQLQQNVLPQAQLQQIQQQQQLQGQVQEQAAQAQSIAQSRRLDNIQSRIQTNEILSDLERNKGQLDTEKYKAGLEQAATNLRLQTNKYVQDLEREGNRARLDDEGQFREKLADSAFGNNRQLLEKQLGNKSILDTNDREFRQAMSRMSIDDAFSMFRDETAANRQRALYSGIGAVTGAGVGAYGTYAESQQKKGK